MSPITTMEINIADLTWESFIYPRGGKNEKTINAYVEALAIGVQFPPIKIQRVLNYPNDNEKTEATLILDGIHRWFAFREKGIKEIPAAEWKDKPQIRQRDLQEIYSLYVRQDIKDLGDIADVTGYNRLVSLLSLQIGNLVKDQELALSSGLSRPTVKKYLFLLENTYVLKLVLPFFTNKRTEIVKTPKVYFEDIGLRNGVLNNFSPLNQRTDSGAILENFVFSQLSKHNEQSDDIRFWRSQTKSEVDFIWQKSINAPCPIEVKFNYVQKQPLPPGLRSFISIYHPARAFIIHLGGFHFRKFKDTNLYAIPAWAI